MLILSRVHYLLFLFITSSCLNSLISLAEFLKTLPPNIPLPSNSYFLVKTSPISQVATDRFFSLLLPSSSSFFLFLLSFSFVGVIFEIVGSKKPDFCLFFTQMAAKLVFKKRDSISRGFISAISIGKYEKRHKFRDFTILANSLRWILPCHCAQTSSTRMN